MKITGKIISVILAVILLTKVYMGAYLEKKINRERAARGESEADNT